jgi:transcriptional regulator with XRE-family HTH domain
MIRQRPFRNQYFRAWRLYRNLTLETVAARMEMTPSHLSMLERGARGYNQDTLRKLAAALRVDVLCLLRCNPADEIWQLWARAKPGQRARIEEAGRNLLKKG